jgi:hypothetical protein
MRGLPPWTVFQAPWRGFDTGVFGNGFGQIIPLWATWMETETSTFGRRQFLAHGHFCFEKQRRQTFATPVCIHFLRVKQSEKWPFRISISMVISTFAISRRFDQCEDHGGV